MNTQNANVANNPALQGAMANAILEANKAMEQQAPAKKVAQPIVGTAPAIVPRKDLLNNNILFLADTQNRDDNSIQYWDGKKGSQPTSVSLAFYKSTKPIESEEEVKKLVQDFSKQFGKKEVILRQRLIKESVLNRDADGKAEKTDVDAYKQKLIAAITKAIMEA